MDENLHYEKQRIESVREKRWTTVHHEQAMLETTTCERSNPLFGWLLERCVIMY
jgi:hypothetical protein